MAIDFESFKFGGSNKAAAAATGQRTERPKAQFWLNIGYSIDVTVHVEGGNDEVQTRFVSLPMGMPLDTMEDVSTRSKNEGFAAFMSARNQLKADLLEACKALKPGEERIIGGSEGLQIQVRRVEAEQAAIAPSENPFVRKLNF